MSDYLFLVPLSLALGLIALAAFFWSLRSEQYDDLDGAAERILVDDDRPLTTAAECRSADDNSLLTRTANRTAIDGPTDAQTATDKPGK